MTQYFLKAAAASAIFAFAGIACFAQEETESVTRHNSDDVIIIRPKENVHTKITVEIKGDAVTINGKPLSEFKNDDIDITRRKEMNDNERMSAMDVMRAPGNRFRAGTVNGVNGYGGAYAPRVESIRSNKAFLGISSEKSEEGEGVIVQNVTEGSAAEKAGLKKADIITKINDTKISSPADLSRTIGKFNPEEKITVTYKRDKKEQKTTAVLSKRKIAETYSFNAPDYQVFKNFDFDNSNNFNFNWNGKPRLGLKAQETEDGKGLKVLDVDDESAAEKAGIKEGDIITSFDGSEVNNIDKLRDLSKAALDKGSFKIQITRDGKPQEITVKIPKDLKTTNL